MKTHGLPERVRGGLHEDEIVAIFADESEARQAAAGLLGEYPVRLEDVFFAEVVVKVMVQPKVEGLTAGELSRAAVEAVRNAVRRAEQEGHRHGLKDRAALGMSEAVELKDQIVVASRAVLSEIESEAFEEKER